MSKIGSVEAEIFHEIYIIMRYVTCDNTISEFIEPILPKFVRVCVGEGEKNDTGDNQNILGP